MAASILVVDDEKNIRSALSRSLTLEGHVVLLAESLSTAREYVCTEPVDLILLDVRLPDGNGLEALEWLIRQRPHVPVVVMSGHASVEMAVEAVQQRGAYTFLEKPLSMDKLQVVIHNALSMATQASQLRDLQATLAEQSEILGCSPAIDALKEMITLAARSQGRVLITGESGTGKELIARALHRQSDRAARPFIKLNCAAIPGELIESELFGHERGAFTGATHARKGKFELAHEGILFLDEIGDMQLDVQAKLLRALQEGEIERVGGSRTISVDVRVFAATNHILEDAIADGRFREDLYYRINVVPIEAPPLRQRRSDIPLLAHAFVSAACKEHGRRAMTVAPEALEGLVERPWPGNVRELKNACERLVILTPGEVIDATAVARLMGPFRAKQGGRYEPGRTLREHVLSAERHVVSEALAYHEGHMTRTAESLGLERSHLYRKMKALDIERT